MNSQIEQLILFLDNPSLESIRANRLSYSDRAQGIRLPESPTGFLVHEAGSAVVYSGGSFLAVDKQGNIKIRGNSLDIECISVDIRNDPSVKAPTIKIDKKISACVQKLNGFVPKILNRNGL